MKFEDLRETIECSKNAGQKDSFWQCDCDACTFLQQDVENFFPSWDDPFDIDDADW